MAKINPAEIIGRACGIQPKKGYQIAEIEFPNHTKGLPPPEFGRRQTINTVLIQEDKNGRPIGIEPAIVYIKRS
jgi:hypothetical protein